MSVTYISFSAHADYTETSEFIDAIMPAHIILVHGDASEGVGRMRYALEARYKDTNIKIVAPRNCQTVQLQFRAPKIAKTIGSLALHPPQQGQRLSGLLVRKNFIDYTLIHPDELENFTSLASTSVEQTLKVPFYQTMECLRYFVGQMYDLEEGNEQKETQTQGDSDSKQKEEGSGAGVKVETNGGEAGVTKDTAAASPAADGSTKHEGVDAELDTSSSVPSLTVHGSVTLSLHSVPSPHVVVSWQSNPVSDMLSDSLLALMANMQSNPGMAKVIGSAGGCRNARATGHTHKHTAHCNHGEDAASGSAATAGESVAAKPAFSGSAEDASYFASALKPSAPSQSPSFLWFLQQHYGSDIVYDAAAASYSFTLNGVSCVVRMKHLDVECADPELRHRIKAMVRRAHAACNPITRTNTAQINEIEEESKQSPAVVPAPAGATATQSA